MARNWETKTEGQKKICGKTSGSAPYLFGMAVIVLLASVSTLALMLPAEADFFDSVLPSSRIVFIEAFAFIAVFVFGACYIFKLSPVFLIGVPFILSITPAFFISPSDTATKVASTLSAFEAVLIFSIVPIILAVLGFLVAGAKTELVFDGEEVRYFFGYGLGSVEKKYPREKVQHLLLEKHILVIPEKGNNRYEPYGKLKLMMEFHEELVLVDAGNWDDTLFDAKDLSEFFGIPLEERFFDENGKMKS